MGLLNYLTYDGVNSSDYGVFISGAGVFNAPARRGESITIPGRNGTLFMDEGAFENIEVNYPAFIGTGYENIFRTALASLRSELTSRGNYKRLTDTYHVDEFRLAVYKSGLEVEPKVYNRAGGFTIKFDCKPQRFLVSGETAQVFTAPGTITNPTEFASSPIIKVTGNGTVAIGNYLFTVKNNTTTIIIDTELMDSYVPASDLYLLTDENGNVLMNEIGIEIEVANGNIYPLNMNSHIEFANSIIPKIEPGEVRILKSNTITRLEIIPRWWRL